MAEAATMEKESTAGQKVGAYLPAWMVYQLRLVREQENADRLGNEFASLGSVAKFVIGEGLRAYFDKSDKELKAEYLQAMADELLSNDED